MKRDDILNRLDRMDMEAFVTLDDDKKYHLVIVGGSGLVLLQALDRATHDIDAIDASRAIQHLLEKYDANLSAGTFINNFPHNFEDRLQKVPVGGRKIVFYTASLEDIVVAKLCSDRDTDRQDIISPTVLSRIDWELLKHLALDEDEAKASALNERRYNEFLYDYREYVRRYGPHEEDDV